MALATYLDRKHLKGFADIKAVERMVKVEHTSEVTFSLDQLVAPLASMAAYLLSFRHSC